MIDFLAIAEAATLQQGLRNPQILIVFSGREAFIDSPQSAFGGQLPSAREAKTTSSFLKSDQLTLTPDRVARSSQQGQQAQATAEHHPVTTSRATGQRQTGDSHILVRELC